MIPYILYVALILTACLIFYKLLLQKETFFHLNRLVLLGCMALAFILPVIHIPQELSFRNAPTAYTIPPAKTPAYDAHEVQPQKENITINFAEPVQIKQPINF